MKLRFTIAIAIIIGAALSSCSTTGPDPAANARHAGLNAAGTAALKEAGRILGPLAVQTIFAAVQAEGQGKDADLLHSAARGLWTQVNSTNLITSYSNIVTAFSAGKARQTAAEVEKAASAAVNNGATPAQAAGAAATVISTAAGAPPAK